MRVWADGGDKGSGAMAQAVRDRVARGLGWLMRPFVRALANHAITPNQISWAGACVTFLAAGLVAAGQPVWGGGVFLAGSLLDLLDGAVARHTGLATPAGALLDSTLDRISEGAMLAAIAYAFADAGNALGAALVVLALLASQLVSYVRARAEGLGFACKSGLATRAERVVLITGGLLLDRVDWAIGLLLVLSAVTAAQRYRETVRQIRAADRPSASSVP